MSKIYFIVTIDTECDKSKDWSVRHPLEFKNILEGIPNRLQPVFKKHGVKPTYLLSPEVISNSKCAGILKNLDGENELGTHLHGEFIEPEANFNATSTSEFQADYPYDLEREKINNLTNLFTQVFGYRPQSFRAGRFGIGPNTLRILREYHYKVDSSIFPFNKFKTKNHFFDFYYFPVKPYYPDMMDYSKTAKSGQESILHVPMTVHSRLFQTLPRAIGKPLSSSGRAIGLLSKIFGRQNVKTISLRPSTNSFEQMKGVCERHEAFHRADEKVFLNMMFHSNEFEAGASPYAKTEQEVCDLLNRLEKMFIYAESRKMHFITMSDTAGMFKPVNSFFRSRDVR